MEVKPAYKQTDVGIIPEDWDVLPCRELCIKIQDGTHFSPKIRGNDYLYVTSKNVGFGILDVETADQIDATQHRAIYRRCDVKKGDLLLTKDGANTGNAALNTLGEELSLLSSVAFLRFDPSRHAAGYFLQQILSGRGQHQIKDAMSGNAITRLTLEKIRNLKFPVPSPPEQRAIAEALSDVDALLSGLDRLITKKRDLKQAAMQQLLTGQIRLPGFHGEWEVKTFSDVFIKVNAKAYQVQTSEYRTIGAFPVVDQGQALVVGFTEREDKRFKCPVGGVIIFGDHTCIVKFVDFDFVVGADGTQILAAKAGHCARFYAFHLQAWGITPTGYNRHFKFLKEREFVSPLLPEQTAIADILSDMDEELIVLEQRREKTRALKQAMMQQLLTGRTRLV